MAVTGQTSLILPMHSSEAKWTFELAHAGGEFIPIVIEVSEETLLALFVTRQVNLTSDVTPAKNAAFTTMLGD